jgi:hypothetical protein
MQHCPACSGTITRLPSSRLDRLVGWVTGRRPVACTQCLWVGRRVPDPHQRRVRHRDHVMGADEAAIPHRRSGERLSSCPVCGHASIARTRQGRLDRLIAALTGREPLVCGYCLWTGRRRPRETVKTVTPQAV